MTASPRLEIALVWQGQLIDVWHGERQDLTIGTLAGADLFVPLCPLAATNHRLFRFDDQGQRFVLHAPPGVAAQLRRGDEVRPLSIKGPGALCPGEQLQLSLGALDLHAQLVDPMPMLRLPPSVDATMVNVALMVGAAFVSLVALLLLLPPALFVGETIVPAAEALRPLVLMPTPKKAKTKPRSKTIRLRRSTHEKRKAGRPLSVGRTQTPDRSNDDGEAAAAIAALFGPGGQPALASLVATPIENELASALRTVGTRSVASADGFGGGLRGTGGAVDTGLIGLPPLDIRGRDLGLARAGDEYMLTDAKRDHELTVQPGQPECNCSLDRDLIRQVVRRHLNQIRYCYERQLGRHPDVQGRVTMQWSINEAGRVTHAETLDSTLNNPTVESCLARKIKRWRFIIPQGTEGETVVRYPFVLKRSGS